MRAYLFIKKFLEAHNRKTCYIKQLKIDEMKSLIGLTNLYLLIVLRLTCHRLTRNYSFRTYPKLDTKELLSTQKGIQCHDMTIIPKD